MASTVVTHERPGSIYERFFRKPENQHQTHYCPGCGHGIVHKQVAQAIDELGIQDRSILISPVGCSVFAYYYMDVGNIQAAHGRAAAVATAVKRARPHSIVLSYQGDGDLAAIGTAEIVHAANRGENISVIFINNAIYGMTGGQMAPTTPLHKKTTTSPLGRSIRNEGPPLRVAELLNALEGPVYIERVSLHDSKNIMKAGRAIRKAIENQVHGLGFSLVEVLSPCPTIWRQEPVEAKRWLGEEMVRIFPPGVLRDRTKEAAGVPVPMPAQPPDDIAAALDLVDARADHDSGPESRPGKENIDLRIKVAGFGGQGVLLLGQILAEAGLDNGLEVSWLPSYGPEMRSGTSHCHVRITSQPVDSPLVSRPNVLMALNEPSLRKFLPTMVEGSWVFYNSDHLPGDVARDDVHFFVRPFSKMADRLGSPRVANMIMLGAMLGQTGAFQPAEVTPAVNRAVKKEGFKEINRRALEAGLDSVRNGNSKD